MTTITEPIDVWLKMHNPAEDENGEDYLAEYEANTFRTETGFEIHWYHNDVGLVSRVSFDTLADAYDWYESNGFENFTA